MITSLQWEVGNPFSLTNTLGWQKGFLVPAPASVFPPVSLRRRLWWVAIKDTRQPARIFNYGMNNQALMVQGKPLPYRTLLFGVSSWRRSQGGIHTPSRQSLSWRNCRLALACGNVSFCIVYVVTWARTRRRAWGWWVTFPPKGWAVLVRHITAHHHPTFWQHHRTLSVPCIMWDNLKPKEKRQTLNEFETKLLKQIQS